jgi:hypothetical protein
MQLNNSKRATSTASSPNNSVQTATTSNHGSFTESLRYIASRFGNVSAQHVCEPPVTSAGRSNPSADPPLSALSSSVSRSVSTSDSINFKLIHYESALKVIDELLENMDTPAATDALSQLSALIEKTAKTLRENQLTDVKFDNHSVRSNIGGQHKRSKLTDLFRNFNREQTTLIKTGTEGDRLPESTRHVHIRTALACLIHGRLRRIGIQSANTSIAALDRQIFEQYVDVLQSRRWENIEIVTALKFPDSTEGMRTLTFKTTMIPAKNMDEVLAENYRRDGINGICSYSNCEERHAVNMWRTEFKPERITDDQHAHVFSGLRHGVHDAYGIDEPTRRESANDARVREFLHAALLNHLKRNDLKIQDIDTNRTVEIDVVSVNLLTTFGKEMKMIEHQQAAFSRATGVEIRIEVADEFGFAREIKVKPRIMMFSTPVDYLALGKVAELIGVWRKADSINKMAIKTLIGSAKKSEPIGGIVACCIARLNTELATVDQNDSGASTTREAISGKIKLITQLVDEIRNIFSTNSHHRIGNEPYKLPTRLLALANEAGLTPAYNCKSGKDRTGQLNVEIRDLYAHLNATDGQLRKVNTRREGFARENFQKLFIAGGDRDIQAMNTGAAGSKSQLHYYNKLMGIRPGTIDEIKGLSKWVGT